MAYIDVSIAKSRFRPLPLPCAMALLHPEEENVVFSSLQYMRLVVSARLLEGKQQRREKKRREDWQRHEVSITECSSMDPRGASGVQAGTSMEADWSHRVGSGSTSA